MRDWITKVKSIVRAALAVLNIRLIDPIEVFFLPEENTFYPIISKSACSSIKVMLIRRFVPDFESSFPEIHQIDPSVMTKNRLQKVYFHQMRKYENWCEGKKMVLVIREPVSRFYSCYIDIKRGKNRMYQYPGQVDWLWKFEPDISFDSFLDKVYNTKDSLSDRHFRSQTFYLNARIQKVLSKLDVHALGDFMNTLKTSGSDTAAPATRLNTNKETLSSELRLQLKNNRHFQERFKDDINLYKIVKSAAADTSHI